jgi:HAD superfamily hydrolase (TIGR01490 family)
VFLSLWLVLYTFKLVTNWRAKNAALTLFLGGESVTAFQDKCDEFAHTVIPTLVRVGALEAIRRYQEQGAKIVVVSASPENWLQPWCQAMGVECIGTRLEIKDGKLTGRIAGKNCYGPEKVRRVLERYRPTAYAEIHAYGDTSGDRELLAMANKGYFRPFRDKRAT